MIIVAKIVLVKFQVIEAAPSQGLTFLNVVGWAAIVKGYDASSIYQLQRKEPKTEGWANAFAPGHAFTITFFIVLSVFLWKRALWPKGTCTGGEERRDA